MSAPTKQVRLPFDNMTPVGLKPIVKKIEKWGLKIDSIDARNTGRRESGVLLKDATFTFQDGQKMLVRVKSDGTVFQVRLNNKPVPIKNVDDVDKAIIEMVDYVEANAKAYERAKIQREKRRLMPDPPAITTSRQEKLLKVQADLQHLNASVGDLEKQSAQTRAKADAKKTELEQAQAALEAEKNKTSDLERQFAALGAA